MNTEKRIGKIQSITVGYGGYQDAMVGISVTLGSDKEGWGCCDFKGMWAMERSKHCKWTEEDRLSQLGEAMMFLAGLLDKSKKRDANRLVGVPVEVTFEDRCLKSWRILEEVI